MTGSAGTRTRQLTQTIRIDQGQNTRDDSRDPGSSKNVTASITLTASPPRITAANGTFTNFALNDILLVSGTNLNNDYLIVTGLDATNHAYLTVDPPPTNEGPITAGVQVP